MRRIHRVDCVLDGTRFGVQTVAGLIPDADGEHGVKRDRLALHQRVDLLLLLFHDGEQRNLFLAGVVTGHAVVFFFLLVDFLRNREGINIHGDGVIKQPQIGEALDDAGIGGARPAGEHDEAVVMAVEEEAKVRLAAALAVPAVFLDRKFRLETVRRVEIEAVVERRIEKPFVMPEMIEIGHRQNPRATGAEDFQQQTVDVIELGFELVQQGLVIVAPRGGGLE